MALTKRDVDSFVYEGKNRSADYRHDTHYGSGGVKGFATRVHPPGRRVGRKTFEVWYRMAPSSTPKWFIIGEYGTWSVQQARAEAQRILVGVAMGIDPKAPHRDDETSLEDFAEVFLEDMRVRGKSTVAEMKRRIYKHLVPALGKKSVSSITRADASKLLSQIGKRAPKEANRVVQLLKTVINRAELLGYVPEGHANPCRKLPLFKEQSRDRYLDDRELIQLSKALEDEPVWVQGLIRFLLLSGLRKMELLSLPWDAVKFNHPEGDHIDISMTKNGRPLRLALTPDMVSVLQAIPTRMHSPWVFPSPVRTGHHLADFKRIWERIRSKANLPDVNVHDLRRTTGSIMAQAGVPLEHIRLVLNQSSDEVARIYARLHKDNQREALTTASEVLNNIFGELVA